MKRFLLCSMLLIAASGLGLCAQSSADSAFPLTIDTFEGLYYNAESLPSSMPSDLLGIISLLDDVINNFRASALIDFEARLGKIGGFGGETGAYYFIYKDTDGNIVGGYLDLPYRIKFSLTAGFFKAEAFGGVLFAMWFDSSHLMYYPYLEAGGRIALGPVYLEGSYSFPLGWEYEGFPRFGIGALLPISR
jgi:hypothetical protein